MFVGHTVFYDIWSLKVNWFSYRPPTAHFCFTAPLDFLTAHFGYHCSKVTVDFSTTFIWVFSKKEKTLCQSDKF